MKLGLRKIRNLLFSSKGRIGRKDYWVAQFCVYPLLFFVIKLLQESLHFSSFYYSALEKPPASVFLVMILALCLVVLFIYVNIATSIKRWHDRNRSGWWASILFFPGAMGAVTTVGGAWQVANLLMMALLVWQTVQCFCLRGTVGQNRYGPNPIAFQAKDEQSLAEPQTQAASHQVGA